MERASVSPFDLELLWRQLEDAKLKLDHCHNYLREINQDSTEGVVSEEDGKNAYQHALVMQEQAVSRYLSAINDFKAAVALDTLDEDKGEARAVDEHA